MSKNKRLFCSRPFRWFEVTQVNKTGDVYMCCPSWLDTPIGNLQNQSVEEIWNGKKAQDIRSSILDGSFKYCSFTRCPFLQTESEPVQKIEDVTDPDLIDAIENKLIVLPYGPREINCSYDRSCNLSCPSCREELIVETKNKRQILDVQNKIHSEALKEAHLLYITGSGDSFGSPFFREWLQTMKRDDMPNLEKMHLHTNGLLWTPRMWSTISEDTQKLIKSAEISIDAASAETYSVNRRGGSFERLLKNLEFIGSLRTDGPLEWLGISMVVQDNNFREMPEFVHLGKRFHADMVYFSQLVNWGTYSDEEFINRAVHLPKHPRNKELIELIKSDIFKDPVVYLGNLTNLATAKN